MINSGQWEHLPVASLYIYLALLTNRGQDCRLEETQGPRNKGTAVDPCAGHGCRESARRSRRAFEMTSQQRRPPCASHPLLLTPCSPLQPLFSLHLPPSKPTNSPLTPPGLPPV